MGKYIFTNWETVPFKKKSFEGQSDRYVKVCVATEDNPQKILAIIPLFGFDNIVEKLHDYELGKIPFPEFLKKPADGGFEEVQSRNGPLFHRFTPDEAKYGLCRKSDVWKAERLPDGKVKVYHSIKVFCHYRVIELTGEKIYQNGWFPWEMYNRYYRFNYLPLSDLTEPFQI